MSALPAAAAATPSLAGSPQAWPERGPAGAAPEGRVRLLRADPGLGLGLDSALQWPGLERRLAPVLGTHGLVAIYHRSVALAGPAAAAPAPVPVPASTLAQVFWRQLVELLGADLAERLLPDAATRR